MPDHVAHPDFERRLAEELARYAQEARDPRPTSLVAAEVVRLAQRHTRRPLRLDRRLMLLAAVLLVPLALAIAAGTADRPIPSEPDAVVVVRPTDGAVEVVLADGQGGERLLRRLTAAGLGLDEGWQLTDYGSVSRKGWLAMGAERPLEGDPYGRRTTYEYVLVDLADPERAPFEVQGNGFSGPRWGPNGELAVYCDYPPDCGTAVVPEPDIGSSAAARVIDPDAGPSSEVIVRDVSLHGGGPEIIWAADGSGLLHRSGSGSGYGITPLDGGGAIPGSPRILSRTMRVDDGRLVSVSGVSERFSSDGQASWVLREDPGSERTLLVRKAGPDGADEVHPFDVRAGTVHGFELAPEDRSVLFYVGAADRPDLMLLPIPEAGVIAPERPVIRGRLAGFVPAAEADSWPTG